MHTPLHRLAFGEQLRILRREAGWSSQEALAHHLQLDRTYVSGIERGVRNPTLDVIVQLAHGLELRPGELLATLGARCVAHDEDEHLMCRACRAGPQGWPTHGADLRLHHSTTDLTTPTGETP